MAHYVITSERGTATYKASSADDAVEEYLDKHGITWNTYGDWPIPVEVKPATVREAMTAEYGEDWARRLSHVVDVAEDRRYQRHNRGGYPSYDVDVVEVLVINHTKDQDVYGYEDAVEVSNYRVLMDQWTDVEGLTNGPWSNCSVIALDLDSEAPEDLTDVLDSLENYPVLDEDEWSTVEQEMIREHWDSYGKHDTLDAVSKAIDVDTLDFTDAMGDIVERLTFDGFLDYGHSYGYPEMIDSSAIDFGEQAVAEFIRDNLDKVVTLDKYGRTETFNLTNLIEQN